MKGSQTTFGGWEPKTCCWCGGKIVKSRQSCGFRYDDIEQVAYSWHTECGDGPKRSAPTPAAPKSSR